MDHFKHKLILIYKNKNMICVFNNFIFSYVIMGSHISYENNYYFNLTVEIVFIKSRSQCRSMNAHFETLSFGTKGRFSKKLSTTQQPIEPMRCLTK